MAMSGGWFMTLFYPHYLKPAMIMNGWSMEM